MTRDALRLQSRPRVTWSDSRASCRVALFVTTQDSLVTKITLPNLVYVSQWWWSHSTNWGV